MAEKDNVSSFREVLQQAKLNSDDELNSFMHKLALSYDEVFRRRDAQNKNNLRNQGRKSANDSIALRSVTFACVYEEERKTESTGKRESMWVKHFIHLMWYFFRFMFFYEKFYFASFYFFSSVKKILVFIVDEFFLLKIWLNINLCE